MCIMYNIKFCKILQLHAYNKAKNIVLHFLYM